MLAVLSYGYLCFKLCILFGFVNHGEMKSMCARFGILITFITVFLKQNNCCGLTFCIDYLFHLIRNICCDGYFWNKESKQCESEYHEKNYNIFIS